MDEMNRAEARRADQGDTSFVVRQTTKRHKRFVPANAELSVRRQGLRGLFGRLSACVDSLCELSMTATLGWKPALREELRLDLRIGPYGERFEILGVVKLVEPSPERANGWRVEIEFARTPAALKVCLRSI